MKKKTVKVLFTVSIIMIVSLILNIIILIKLIKDSEPLYGAYYINREKRITNIEVLEDEAIFNNFFWGEYDSQTISERLNYIYHINLLRKENEDKMVDIIFENTKYRIMNDEQLKKLQKEIKSYKGNYDIKTTTRENTVFVNTIILKKV